jgi:hypothetical protein
VNWAASRHCAPMTARVRLLSSFHHERRFDVRHRTGFAPRGSLCVLPVELDFQNKSNATCSGLPR